MGYPILLDRKRQYSGAVQVRQQRRALLRRPSPRGWSNSTGLNEQEEEEGEKIRAKRKRERESLR